MTNATIKELAEGCTGIKQVELVKAYTGKDFDKVVYQFYTTSAKRNILLVPEGTTVSVLTTTSDTESAVVDKVVSKGVILFTFDLDSVDTYAIKIDGTTYKKAELTIKDISY